MTDQQKINYLKTYYPLAVEAGKQYNINPVVIVAQSIHESGWGTSYGARIRRNFFGITSYGSKNTYWNGAKSMNNAGTISFRVYKTAKDSFFDFARLIKEVYPSAAGVSSDYAQYAKAIANSKYISESNGDNRPAYEKAIIDNSKFIISNLATIEAYLKNAASNILPAIGLGLLIAILLH